jgi:hypothetical protein
MENQAILKIPRSFSSVLTPTNLCIASTLIAPLVLLIFLPLETVLIITMLALFGLTIAVFHISKDRDNCRHYWEICKNLLEEETKNLREEKKKVNRQMISCKKFIETPEAIVSISPSSDLTGQTPPSPHLFYSNKRSQSTPDG